MVSLELGFYSFCVVDRGVKSLKTLWPDATELPRSSVVLSTDCVIVALVLT